MASAFVTSMTSHGVFTCYGEEQEKGIRAKVPFMQAHGHSMYVEADGRNLTYPIEYFGETDQVVCHLRDQALLAIGNSGEVSKSFLYPSGEVLVHKVTVSRDERRNCSKFTGNPHIIQIRFVGIMGILYEYMNGGDLARFDTRQLSAAQRVAIYAQIIRGVAAIHEQGFVHRDLRPRNILVNTNPDGTHTVKICDFECMAEAQKPAPMQGHVRYRSPSLLAREAHGVYDGLTSYDQDFWALGVTIYEIEHGVRPPFCDKIGSLCNKLLPENEMESALEQLDNEIQVFCERSLADTAADMLVRKLLLNKVIDASTLLENSLMV